MSRPDPRNVCDGCGLSFDRRLRAHVELGPIVHDDIWQQLANDPRGASNSSDKRVVFLGDVEAR